MKIEDIKDFWYLEIENEGKTLKIAPDYQCVDKEWKFAIVWFDDYPEIFWKKPYAVFIKNKQVKKFETREEAKEFCKNYDFSN